MITPILTIGQTILSVLQRTMPESKEIKSGIDLLTGASNTYNLLKSKNLNQLTQHSIVNPMIVIDRDIQNEEYMSDLLNIIQLRDIRNILNYFTIRSTVNGINLGNIIAGVSTKRAGFMSLAAYNGFEALENLNDRVPGSKDRKDPSITIPNSKSSINADFVESPPLALGRTVIAETYIDNVKLSFPINFKFTPMIGDKERILKVFSASKIEEGYGIRNLMVKTGEITRTEFFSGSDVIKQRFKSKDDETLGYIKEMDMRQKRNTISAIKTGILNVNAEANTFILSKETARAIEIANGAKFANESSRKKIFSVVAANNIVVVDSDREVFTIYMNGISVPDQYTRSEIKLKTKADNVFTLDALVKLLGGK